MPTRDRLVCLLICLAAATGPPAGAGEEENARRLRAMPREQRAALAAKLKQFEALSRDEKGAIRQLDEQVAALPPSERVAYLAALRRYYLWVQSLSEAQRTELQNTPPERRMALITRFRNQGAVVKEESEATEFLRVIDFGAPSPFEMAREINLWLSLPPARRAEVEKLPPGPERQSRLLALTRGSGVGPETRPSQAEVDALIRQLKEEFKAKGWAVPIMEKLARKDARAKHPEANREDHERRRIAEHYFFVVHPPRAVDARHLEWFRAALPGALHALFDHLPPEEARRRLTVLYRLVYPHPREMPPPETAATPRKAAATKAPAPAPRPSPGSPPANPF